MPEGHVLEFSGLTKRYGAVTAVDDFTARIEPGIVTGFLGPNGAGKTTTLRMLLGLVRPTSGTATIGGTRYADLRHPARSVGAVLEATSFHPGRTAAAHLRVYAQAAGIPTSRVQEVLDLVGLSDAGGRKVGGFSLGMRQRLALATALLGDPEVLVLDEPTNGLDPEGIQWIRVFLRALAAEGRTVLVSSHMLSEVQQTVDALIMIANGRLVFSGDFGDLMADAEQSVSVDSPDRAALGAALTAAGLPATLLRNGFTITGGDVVEIGGIAAAAGVPLSGLSRRGPSLEDVFFELVNGERVHPSGQRGVAVAADAVEAAAPSDDAALGAAGAAAGASVAAGVDVETPAAAVADAAVADAAVAGAAVPPAPSAATPEPPLTTTENAILGLLTPDETGAVPIVDLGAADGASDADGGSAEVSDDTMAITIDDMPGIAAGDAVAAMRARGESIQLPFDGAVTPAPGLVVAAAAMGGASDDAAVEAAADAAHADAATSGTAEVTVDAAEPTADATDVAATAEAAEASPAEEADSANAANDTPVRLASGDRAWWEPADIAMPTGTISIVDPLEATAEPEPIEDAEVVADELPAAVVAEIAETGAIVLPPRDADDADTTDEPAAPADEAPAAEEAASDNAAPEEAVSEEAASEDAAPEVAAPSEHSEDDAADDDADAEADEAATAEPAADDAAADDTVTDAAAEALATDVSEAAEPVTEVVAADDRADAPTADDAAPAPDTTDDDGAPTPAPPAPWWLPSQPATDATDPADATDTADASDVTDAPAATPPLFHAPAPDAVTAPIAVTPDEAWAPRDVDSPAAPWTPPAAPGEASDDDAQPETSVFEVAATGEIAIINTGVIQTISDAADPATAALSFDDLLAATDDAGPAGDDLLVDAPAPEAADAQPEDTDTATEGDAR